jgi:hypothetical protein
MTVKIEIDNRLLLLDSQGLWGPHEQYLSDPWAPGHAVLCVWKPE